MRRSASCWSASCLLLCVSVLSSSQIVWNRGLDWTRVPILSVIKNQSVCGSCWVHATLAVVEAQLVLTGTLPTPPTLASQPLLECGRHTHGCAGGTVHEAVVHLHKHGAILHDDSIPSNCNYALTVPLLPPVWVQAVVLSPSYVTFLEALNTAPFVVLVSSLDDEFLQYREGIFNGRCVTPVNHAMVLVGFNPQMRYWKLRNSWGTHWGEQGYMRITFHAAEACGMFREATRITLAHPRVNIL